MSEQLERKKIELQILFQHIQTLQNQIQAISQQVMEMNSLSESISELEKTAPDTEILVPLGAGIFANAKLTNTKEVLMNVGAKITVPKTMKEAREIISRQVKELEKLLEHMESELRTSASKADQMQKDFQEAISKNEK